MHRAESNEILAHCLCVKRTAHGKKDADVFMVTMMAKGHVLTPELALKLREDTTKAASLHRIPEYIFKADGM